MIESLDHKHLIVVSDRAAAWREYVEAVSAAQPWTGVYGITIGEGGYDDYLQQVREKFPIQSPIGLAPADMSNDQVADVQLDWVGDRPGSLILLDHLERLSPDAQHELVCAYVTELVAEEDATPPAMPSFRLLGFAQELPGFSFEKAELYYGLGEDDPRSIEDVFRGCLDIVVV